MFVVDGLGHERDADNEDTGDNEEDDAKVEVVNATDDGGTCTGFHTASCPIDKLCYHPGETNKQAYHQPIKRTLLKQERERKG